jgi:hypothetical protein
VDETTRADFVARIKRDVAALTDNDRKVMEHVVPIILKLTADPRMSPLTLLTPDEEAIKRIDLDDGEEIGPELRDRVLGLFLDQVILGKLPAVETVGEYSTQTVFSTIGGASTTVTAIGGELALTDTFGRTVRVSQPVMDGPKITCRISNDLLMWDEWKWF